MATERGRQAGTGTRAGRLQERERDEEEWKLGGSNDERLTGRKILGGDGARGDGEGENREVAAGKGQRDKHEAVEREKI